MWSMHPQSAPLTRTAFQFRFNMIFSAEFTTFIPDVTSIWSTANNRLLILQVNNNLKDADFETTFLDLKNPIILMENFTVEKITFITFITFAGYRKRLT
jgi:hypothetical protein